MPFGPVLIGDHLVLRPGVPADVDARVRLGRHAEIARGFGAPHPVTEPISRAEADAWFSMLGRIGVVDWVVETDGSFLGAAGLHSFTGDAASYAVGFFDPDRLGRGFGRAVTRLVLHHAFRQLDIGRVRLKVLADNERAYRCFRACGFREIDRIRSAAVIDGQLVDDIVMETTSEPSSDAT
jgi:RimJ/RimL family protein N-acetyltransferase